MQEYKLEYILLLLSLALGLVIYIFQKFFSNRVYITKLQRIAASLSIVVMIISALSYFDIYITPTLPVAAAADPQVTLTAPSTLIGESFDVTATFANASGVDTGFGPFIDLVLPVNGTDGINGDNVTGSVTEVDGITSINSATYLGSSITYKTFTFPNDSGNTGVQNTGCVKHPFAVDSTASPIEVCGNTGDILVVAQLPFGSFVPGQPNAEVIFNVTMSELADISQPLNFEARGGFMFGNDEFNNPTTDPSIIQSSFALASTSPQIVTFSKTQDNPEAENAIGPNFPYQYTITAAIADGQTVDNMRLVDELPNNMVFQSVVSSSPGCTPLTPLPSTTGPANGSVLTIDCGTIAPPVNSVSATYEVYISDQDANGDEVIDHNSCDDTTTVNNAYGTGDWDPVDFRDEDPFDPLANNSFITPVEAATVTNKCVQIQKSNSIVNDNGFGGYTPGDILEYRLDFQISDYYALGDVNIQDIIDDGVHLLSGSHPDYTAPSLEIFNGGSSVTSGAIDAGNFVVTDNWTGAVPTPSSPDGTTIIDIDVSGELTTRSLSSILYGGCVSSNAAQPIDCELAAPTYNTGSTTGRITYRAEILDSFTDNPGDPSIDHFDNINNNVIIEGAVIDNTDRVSPTGLIEADQSSSNVNIQAGSFAKNIIAINGADPAGVSSLSPGDAVTYQLVYTLPSSDTESFTIEDYLPKPVFDVTTLNTFVTPDGGGLRQAAVSPSYDMPPVGEFWLGPTDTFYALSADNPVITTNTPGNSFMLDFGNFDDPLNTTTVADIVFTVEVSDAPFADGLLLTNQALATEANTNGTQSTATEINQITLDEPKLRITKGVVAVDNPSAVFNPTSSYTGVAFDPAGTIGGPSCQHFTGIINSHLIGEDQDDLNEPIIADIENIDGSDVIRFATIIENTGSNGAFDIQVRDVIPPTGFAVPSSGSNICVTRGDGSSLSTTNVGGGTGLFDQGIEIVDGTTGSALAYDDMSGENIIVITYDLQADDNLNLQEEYSNHAAIFNYASREGGTNFGGPGTGDIVFDSASITPENIVELDKTIAASEEPAGTTDATIGGLIKYQVELVFNEGLTQDVLLGDNLGPGQAFVSLDDITAAPDITTDIAGGFTGVESNIDFSNSTVDFQLDFGNITNTNSDNTQSESIIIEYTAVVLNDGSVGGRGLGNSNNTVSNTALATWSGLDDAGDPENLIVLDSRVIDVVEPELSLSKNIVETEGDAGDTLTVELTLSHTVLSTSTAYNVEITDTLPAGMTFAGGFTTSGVTPTSTTESGGLITIIYDALPSGSPNTVSFTVTLDSTVTPGEAIENEASMSYSSIDGDRSAPVSTQNNNSVEKTYTATSNDTFTVDLYNVEKTILDTSINDLDVNSNQTTTNNNAVVGEHIQYQVVFDIPEGTNPDVVIRDTLDLGLDFVSLDSLTADTNVTTTATGGFTGALGNASFSSLGDGRNRVEIDLDELANTNSNSDIEQITLVYTVVVDNAAESTAGAGLNNNAQLRWGSPVQNVNDNAPNITVQEPVLVPTKESDMEVVNAGDRVKYTIEVTNSGSSPAFDVVIDDQVPNVFSYVSGSASVSSIHTSVINDSAAPNLEFSIDQINVGEVVTIEYEMDVLQVAISGNTYTNEAEITWSSLSGNIAGERTGDQIGENDYYAMISDDVEVQGSSLDKLIVSTAESDTGIGSDGNNRGVIGEVVRFRLVQEVAEATLPNYQVDDYIPDGMQFINDGTATVALISNDGGTANLNSTVIPSGAEVIGNSVVAPTFVIPAGVISNIDSPGNPFENGNDVRFDLGNLINADDDTDSEYVVIEMNVLVTNVLANQVGTPLENIFETFVDDGTRGSIGVSTPSTDSRVIIAEPAITIDKTILSVPQDAGDTVTYEITVTNGTGDNVSSAHNITILDTLSSQLTLDSVIASGFGSRTDSSNYPAGEVNVTFTELAPGGTITLIVEATVVAGVQSGEVINNEATYTYNSISDTAQAAGNPTGSATPGGEGDQDGARNGGDGAGSGLNNYAALADVDFVINAPEIEKFDAANAGYVIGQEMVFPVLVTLPEGSVEDLVVVDEVPDGLVYSNHNIITTAASSALLTQDYNGGPLTATMTGGTASGDDVSLSFGSTVTTADDNVATNNSFVVEFTFRVVNEVANQNGVELTNAARVDYTNPDTSGTDSVRDLASSIEVYEPVLNITKSVNDSNPTFGQTLEYTLFIEHDGTSTADAFDITITDIINSDLTYQVGSASLPPGWTINETGDPVIVFNGDLPLGQAATITFEVATPAAGSISTGSVIPNVADMTWSSLSGNISGQRDGSGGVNDYEAADFEDVTITSPDLSIDINDGIGSTNPGDTNIYDVQVNNLGNGSSDNVTVTITVPAHTTFDPSNSESGWLCTPDNNPGSNCTINLGTINSAGQVNVDYALIMDDEFPSGVDDIIVTAQVSDDGTNGPEADLSNNNSEDVDSLDVAPDLSVIKDDGTVNIAPGGQTTYTLTISNSGTQDATGVLVTDTLPAHTTFNSASDGGLESSGIVTWPVFDLAVNSSVTRTVTLTLSDPIDSGVDTITNEASVTDDGTNGSDLNSSDNNDEDTNNVIAAPDLQVSKALTTSGTLTNSSIVEYTIGYQNIGNQNATGVILTEVVPVGSTFDSGNPLNTGWVCNAVTPGSVCTLAVGNLPVGASGSTTFVVIIDDSIRSDQEDIVNTVSITDDGTNGLDSDSTNNSATNTAPVVATPDLRIEKTDNQTSVTAGQSLTYIIEVFNDGNQNAEDVLVTDTLPVGTTFVSASGGGIENSGIVTWPEFDLNAGSSIIFITTITLNNPVASGVESITNTASVTFAPNSGDVDPTNNNTATDTDTVVAAPDLMVSKTDNGSTLTPGDSFVYDIAYANNGTQGATGVVITDIIPAHTTFDPANSTPGWSCSPDNNPGSTCLLSIGNLSGTDTGMATFAITVDNPLGAGVDLTTNTVSITDDGANGGDENPANNTYDESTTVNALPELYIQKDDAGTTAETGQEILYTISWGNSGNQTATGVALSETVPFGTTIDLSNPLNAGWACAGVSAGSACTYGVGNLDSGDTGSTTFVVIVNNSVASGLDSITNTVSITDDGTNGNEINTANNNDTTTTPLNAAPDLVVTKEDGLTEINPGDEFTYTITVTNSGSQNATGVAIQDTLPSELTYISSSDAGTESGGVVSWPLVNIPVGDTVTRTVTVRFDVLQDQVPAGLESLTNIVTALDDGTNGSDLDGSNNVGEDVNTVNGDIDLIVTIDDGETVVGVGDSVVYEIDITNQGSQFAGNTVATIVLPEGVVFDPANSTPGWICNPDGTTPGSVCTLNVGTVDTVNETNVSFAVIVDNPSRVDEIDMVVSVADDGTSGPELNTSNNTDNDRDNIIGQPNLTVTKTDNQNIATPNATLTYEIEVINNGNIILTGVEVIDTIPQHTTYVSSDNGGVLDTQTSEVIWSGLVLMPGERIILTLEVLVSSTIPSGVDQIINQVVGTDDGTHGIETDTGDNEYQDINTVEARPELEVIIEAQQDLAYPGEELEFIITHINLGDQDASGVEVTFTIPEYTTGQPTSQATGSNDLQPFGLNIGWVCPDLNPGTVCTYLIGDVAAGEDCEIPFYVVLDENLDPANTQIIGQTTVYDDGLNGTEITLVNNDDSDSVVIPFADVEVQKSAQTDNINFGDQLIFTIRYENNGPSEATDVVITDSLPLELAYVSATLNGQSVDPNISNADDNSTNLQFPVGTVPNGGSGEIVLTTEVVRNTNTAIINTVIAAAREAEITMDNNDSATDLIEVYEVLDLPATKGLLRTGGALTQEAWTVIAMFVFGSISITGAMRKRNVD